MADLFVALVQQLRSGDVVLALALGFLVTAGPAWAIAAAAGYWVRNYARVAWQLGALLGLEQAYEFTRGRIPHDPGVTDVAILNSYRVLDFEWRHGFFIESRVERFFLPFHMLMNVISGFYALAHVAVTIGVIGWIYVKRREYYPLVRNLIILTTGLALVAFYVFPTAPPRLLWNYGFVDPAYLSHLVGAGGAQASSYTYNPYAAMPSLHVGYALVVAVGMMVAERRLWVRCIAGMYPCLMSATVIISGNHWVLDVVGAVVTVALAAACLVSASVGAAHLRSAFGPSIRRRADSLTARWSAL